jgi:uncharacterized protein YwqG
MNWIKQLFQKVTVSRSAPASSHGSSSSGSVDVSPQQQADAADIRKRFGHLAQPAVHLRPEPRTHFSRLGGLPNMPAELPWPEWNRKPQSFLAQLDLAEIHAVLPSFLPASGLLYFFYDQEQSVWGFDPKDIGGWRVLYHPGSSDGIAERTAPVGLAEDFVYKPKPVSAHLIDLLPDSQVLSKSEFDWDRDGDAYQAVREEAFEGITHHQVLGYVTAVQNADMETECQLASNGVYVGSPEGYKDPRVESLRPGASEWKLLLQLDTDDECGWMWGDVGTLYFWVRESDARRGDFSKVWMVFQCC